MDISVTIHIINLKYSVCVFDVGPKKIMSQIFDLGPCFDFMAKNDELFVIFFNINFYIS